MSNNSSKQPLKHLGLIIDGNRRWARSQGKSTSEGHKAGYGNVKTIAKAAFERGIDYVSVYTFSTENWNRSQEEVNYLMDLLVWVAEHELKELDKNGIKVQFLGSSNRLSKKVKAAIHKAEEATKNNTKGKLLLCFNYGGHLEISEAVQKVIDDGSKEITPELIEQNLYGGSEIPAVDMIIRTSGEQRISNFMLWRAAYSELYFVDKHWPDFTEADLDKAVAEFGSRTRRFGGN